MSPMPTGPERAERALLVHDHEVLVRSGGSGPDLLFLHGEANTSGWGTVHDALAEHFTVTAPVHPGFGGDPLPEWLDDVTDLSFHYVDLIRELGLERPIVVGVSLGGWIAMDLAVHRSDLLGGVVLVGALGLRPEDPMPDLFIMAAPDALAHLANDIDTASVDPLTGDVHAATALWVEQASQARLMWERPYDPRFGRRAHHVTCPVAVVWGRDDRLLPVAHGERLAATLGVEARIVADAGHFVTIDQPGAVVDAAAALRSAATEENPR